MKDRMTKRILRFALTAVICAGLCMSACAEMADEPADEAQYDPSGAQESGTGDSYWELTDDQLQNYVTGGILFRIPYNYEPSQGDSYYQFTYLGQNNEYQGRICFVLYPFSLTDEEFVQAQEDGGFDRMVQDLTDSGATVYDYGTGTIAGHPNRYFECSCAGEHYFRFVVNCASIGVVLSIDFVESESAPNPVLMDDMFGILDSAADAGAPDGMGAVVPEQEDIPVENIPEAPAEETSAQEGSAEDDPAEEIPADEPRENVTWSDQEYSFLSTDVRTLNGANLKFEVPSFIPDPQEGSNCRYFCEGDENDPRAWIAFYTKDWNGAYDTFSRDILPEVDRIASIYGTQRSFMTNPLGLPGLPGCEYWLENVPDPAGGQYMICMSCIYNYGAQKELTILYCVSSRAAYSYHDAYWHIVSTVATANESLPANEPEEVNSTLRVTLDRYASNAQALNRCITDAIQAGETNLWDVTEFVIYMNQLDTDVQAMRSMQLENMSVADRAYFDQTWELLLNVQDYASRAAAGAVVGGTIGLIGSLIFGG